MTNRCEWANKSELEIKYHDNEWGKPVYDDKGLFEFLILEGQQAGLSWDLILKKREGMKKAYLGFDPVKLENLTDDDLLAYQTDDRVIKNKLKIKAVRENARVFNKFFSKEGSFSHFIWEYFDHEPLLNHFKSIKDVPVSTEMSDKISKDLKKLGFKFIGTTTIYSFLQACGMVNDHVENCFLHIGNK